MVLTGSGRLATTGASDFFVTGSVTGLPDAVSVSASVTVTVMEEKYMIVAAATEKMIAFYKGNLHDINHFLNRRF